MEYASTEFGIWNMSMKKGTRDANFLFVHERGARWLSVSTSNYYCMLIGRKSAEVFLAAILSLRGKLGCSVWKFLEVALHKLSLQTASHHYSFHDDFQSSQLSMLKQHLCWLPVITTVPMMTSSHHYCFHDNFQSSYGFHDDFQPSQQTQSWEFHVRSQSACSGWR